MQARNGARSAPSVALGGLWSNWLRKPVWWRFVVQFAALLLLFLWPWPALGRAFASLACAVVNVGGALLATNRGSFRFRPEGPPDSWNAILTLVSPSGLVQEALWELRRSPYLPLAVFAALVLAFPLGERRRRLLVAALGLGVLALLPGLRLLLLLESDTPFRMFEFPRLLRSLLEVACGTLVLPPGMAYALPFLLWLFLLWRLDPRALAAGLRSPQPPDARADSLAAGTLVAPAARSPRAAKRGPSGAGRRKRRRADP